MGGSLHWRTVETLASWIIGGRAAIGDIIPNEAEIGAELGVSRTVVREAVRTLVAKGMLRTRRRLGTEVRPLDAWSLFDRDVINWRLNFNPDRRFIVDIYELRLAVETYSAGRCADDTGFDRDALMSALHQLETAARAGAPDTERLDVAFHECLLAGANNQFFLQLQPIFVNIGCTLVGERMANHLIERTMRDHRDVAEAIRDANAQEARAAMQRLIRNAFQSAVPDTTERAAPLSAAMHA